MLRIGLGMGPGNASPLVRSRAWDHRSNFKPFARPVWPRMANRSIPPLLWTRFGPMRCCSMWCCYVLLIIPIVFPIWFSSINIPDCMQCFEGFKLSMVSGRSAWQFAQVHHVNRYPPNVAPKPGRLADGLTEAGTSSLTSQWFLILRISPDGWESLGQMHLTIWCTATFHAAAAVVFLANVGCQ